VPFVAARRSTPHRHRNRGKHGARQGHAAPCTQHGAVPGRMRPCFLPRRIGRDTALILRLVATACISAITQVCERTGHRFAVNGYLRASGARLVRAALSRAKNFVPRQCETPATQPRFRLYHPRAACGDILSSAAIIFNHKLVHFLRPSSKVGVKGR